MRNRAGTKAPGSEALIAEGLEVDWSRTSPMGFLKLLRREPYHLFTVWNPPPADWLKEEHVAQLMELIDSNEPAARRSPASSALSSMATGRMAPPWS